MCERPGVSLKNTVIRAKSTHRVVILSGSWCCQAFTTHEITVWEAA